MYWQEHPLRKSPLCVPFTKPKGAHELLTKMLQQAIRAEPSISWYFQNVLVVKNGWSLRFCVDYRKLKDATKKVNYSRPKINDTVNFIRGLYEFTIVTFGLHSATVTSEILMRMFFTGLQWKTCLVYLHDVIVIKNLIEMFLRFRNATLKLNLKEYSLFQRNFDFLDHKVSYLVVHINQRRRATIGGWSRPKNKLFQIPYYTLFWTNEFETKFRLLKLLFVLVPFRGSSYHKKLIVVSYGRNFIIWIHLVSLE